MAWSVKKILRECKKIWREKKDLSPKYLQINHLELYNSIYYENSKLRTISELLQSTGSQRWQWVIGQIGLKAKKIKVRNKNSPLRLKPTSLRWVLCEKPPFV